MEKVTCKPADGYEGIVLAGAGAFYIENLSNGAKALNIMLPSDGEPRCFTVADGWDGNETAPTVSGTLSGWGSSTTEERCIWTGTLKAGVLEGTVERQAIAYTPPPAFEE